MSTPPDRGGAPRGVRSGSPSTAAVPPELELTFYMAGTRERRRQARPRLEPLLELVDFEVLATGLARRQLLTLVGTRLQELAPARLPEAFRHRVATDLTETRARGLGIEGLAVRLASELENDGIPVLPLKGPFLASDLHGDAGLRTALDLDLLVAREDVERAAMVLERSGYRQPASGTSRPPGLHRILTHPALPRVDLHWRVHWYEDTFSRDMLRRSARRSDGVRWAQPGDQLVSLLVFFARDGFSGLRLCADVAAWWDRFGQPTAEGTLDPYLVSYPRLARALTVAGEVVQAHGGVPRSALFSAAPDLDARQGIAIRLASWTQEGNPQQIAANVSLIDGLLSPRGQLRAFARRDLLAPWTSIAPVYGGAATSPLLRPYYRLAHLLKMTARYLIALWRTRGGRPWDLPPPALVASGSEPTARKPVGR